MKTLGYKCLFTLLLLVTSGGIANAQGFLSKVSKALSKVTNTTTASSLTDGNKTEADNSNTSDGDSTSIDWDAIPVYHLQVINETNDDGTPQLNTDGTPVTRVLLVDQFGNYRSQEAVEAQRKALKKYITQIIAKVGAVQPWEPSQDCCLLETRKINWGQQPSEPVLEPWQEHFSAWVTSNEPVT